ncbi:MAG: hypothetical protein FWH12_00780 [Treponema sp.]|nr:hypothetical protein [Treponema sp.]
MAKKKSDPLEDSLAKELRSLIPKLDSEGLAFLIEQARVHLYNMQVVELNRAAQEANAAARRSETVAKRSGKKEPVGPQKKKGDILEIQGTASGSSYYLYYQNRSVMFSRDEMTLLVRIAHSQSTDLEIRERIYAWFERERMDIFAVLPVKDKFDPLLKSFVSYLQSNFKTP